MVRAYSMDLCERVVAAVEAGESRRSAARRFGVRESVAVKWLQRVSTTGSVKPSKMGGYRRPALDGEREWLLARFEEKPDVARKRPGGGVARSDRSTPMGLHRRPEGRRSHTWAKTNMTRTYGRAPRGERLVAKVPHGRWTTLTFIAALRCDAITAPLVLDGPINGECFLAWVEQAMIPTLSPGDAVVLDNLGSHKGKAIRQAGAHLLFLPLYSPDLNPIEQVFSKLKTLLRKAAERSVEAVWRRIGALLHQLSPAEGSNYLRHAGYA